MSTLPAELARELRALLGDGAYLDDPADCIAYSYDNSRRHALPQAVALPTAHDQVLALVQACRRTCVPVVPRGRGTNTTGASVPIAGGVVVSFERMNRILEIDADNRVAIVEPGVLNADLQAAAKRLGYFWPPDPTSAAFCTIGGNLACNAGGPRAVKYGTCRENTLALRAVSGAGETLRTGSKTTKGATGYDLTRLLIGSEGTLALITEATLKLIPLPESVLTLRALYDSVEAATRAVTRVMAQPEVPCALEFMDGEALRLARQHAGDAIPAAGALLMLEVDGPAGAVELAAGRVRQAALGPGCLGIEQADTRAAADTLWAARKALSPSLRQIAPKKINEDVVVPVATLPDLLAGLQRISAGSGIPIVNFGHAGNGNIHVNLLYRPEDPAQAAAAPGALSQVFDLVIALGGTLSGEHGIGIDKRDFLPRAIEPATLEIMRAIQRQFDPDGILNPGKLLPRS